MVLAPLQALLWDLCLLLERLSQLGLVLLERLSRQHFFRTPGQKETRAHIAQNIGRGHERRDHAAARCTDAHLSSDGWKESNHRNPLRRIQTKAKGNEPRALAAQGHFEALAPTQGNVPLRLRRDAGRHFEVQHVKSHQGDE